MRSVQKKKVRFVVGSLAGAVAIHVAMVACTSAGGGGVSSNGSGSDGGFLDALVDAVRGLVDSPSAEAAPPVGVFSQIEIAEEPCSVVVGSSYFAEHAYPGVLANDLALRVWVAVSHPGSVNDPPGYAAQVKQDRFFFVKDGSVLVDCGNSSTDGTTAMFRFAK